MAGLIGSIAFIVVSVGEAVFAALESRHSRDRLARERAAYLESEEHQVKRALRSIRRTSIAKAPDAVPVKICGRVRPLDKVVRAPLSGRSCVAFDVRVEQMQGDLWSAVFSERQSCEFCVEDASGRALVRMEAPQMHLSGDVTEIGGATATAQGPITEYLTSRGHDVGELLKKPTRIREGVLSERDFVSIHGIGHWDEEPEPEPERVGGYRQRARRFVLEDHPSQPLQISDDPGTD